MQVATDKIDTTPPIGADILNTWTNGINNPLLPILGQDILYNFLKICLIVFLLVYTVIAIMILKQASLMSKTIHTPGSKYIYAVGMVHLIAVALCLLYAIFII